MNDKAASLDEKETAAQEALSDLLDLPQQLVIRVYDVLGEVAAAVLSQREPRLARWACIKLLHRTSNDLRCLALLAMMGYPAQASTLGASALEAAVTAAYIGDDEEKAQRWWDHTDRWRSFAAMKAAIGEVFEKEKHRFYVQHSYRELCIAKHVNPVHEGGINAQPRNGRVHFFNGPDTGEHAGRSCFFALHVTPTVVGLCVEKIGLALLRADQRDAIEGLLHGANVLSLALSQEVRRRGWESGEKSV